MNIRQIFLFIVAVGLIPIALSYGLIPQISMNYLFDIGVSDNSIIHILRAIMGLYLALSVFWIIGVYKVHLRQAALYSLIVFMLGLAAGRILSLIIEGTPHWLLIVYLLLELGFGTIGFLLVKKPD